MTQQINPFIKYEGEVLAIVHYVLSTPIEEVKVNYKAAILANKEMTVKQLRDGLTFHNISFPAKAKREELAHLVTENTFIQFGLPELKEAFVDFIIPQLSPQSASIVKNNPDMSLDRLYRSYCHELDIPNGLPSNKPATQNPSIISDEEVTALLASAPSEPKKKPKKQQDRLSDEEVKAVIETVVANKEVSADTETVKAEPAPKQPKQQEATPMTTVNTFTETQVKDLIASALATQAAEFKAMLANMQAPAPQAPVVEAPVVPAPAPVAPIVDPATEVANLNKSEDVLAIEARRIMTALLAAKTDEEKAVLRKQLSALTETRRSIQDKLATFAGAGLRGAANITRGGVTVSDMVRNGLIAVVNTTFDGVNYVLNGAADGMDKAADWIDPSGAKATDPVAQPRLV